MKIQQKLVHQNSAAVSVFFWDTTMAAEKILLKYRLVLDQMISFYFKLL